MHPLQPAQCLPATAIHSPFNRPPCFRLRCRCCCPGHCCCPRPVFGRASRHILNAAAAPTKLSPHPASGTTPHPVTDAAAAPKGTPLPQRPPRQDSVYSPRNPARRGQRQHRNQRYTTYKPITLYNISVGELRRNASRPTRSQCDPEPLHDRHFTYVLGDLVLQR